jgi:hypothetical protein
VHVVHEHRQGQAEALDALAGSGESILEVHVLAEQHALVDVRLQLPLVDGVRLRDVDEDGVRAALEAPVDLLDVA